MLGWVSFAGLTLEVDRGVFVPRQHTVALAEAAAALRPSIALDLFAGTGAIAAVIQVRNPDARVVAGELDVRECLRNNCREVYSSDVDDGIPVELEGRVDVLTANVPYVPTAELEYVPHEGESPHALDGGPDGLDWVRRVVGVAPRWLTARGALLTEIAVSQRPAVIALLETRGFCVALSTDRVISATQNGDLSPDA